MSKTTIALEAAVANVIENTPQDGSASSARQRANVDKAFVVILKLIAPRIRHFIRQYGLVSHWDDAEQCCAIAVHRAIAAYDPTKAQFTTFVNWQIRGELQSLRFRVMTDQRPSAKKVDATTVSLHAITSGSDGEETTLESMLEDGGALARTESGASDYLAQAATASLVDAYIARQREAAIDQLRRRPRPKRVPRVEPLMAFEAPAPRLRTQGICPIELDKLEAKLARDKDIVERRMFEIGVIDELDADGGVTKERARQITKRASRSMAELAATQPKFAMMAEYRAPVAPAARQTAAAVATPILPPIGQMHNTLSRLVAIEAVGSSPATTYRADDAGEAVGVEAVIAADRLSGNAPGSAARH